ncbi:MAG: SPFH domain-containing protein [Bacillota bacterium]|nr:hypothetical protein [Bacillota bacterium]
MREKPLSAVNGFVGITVILALLGLGAWLLFSAGNVAGIALLVLGLLLASGIVMVQPNEAKAVVFFGRYLGTLRENGLHLTYPLTSRKRVSLRIRNFTSAKLKVNDVEGNPIEIAAVIAFRVVDSAKALFDVDEYERFVEIQSEAAIRNIASRYPYDLFDQEGISLRSHTEEVAAELKADLQQRLAVAGVEVLEARLTHLAYAAEIAGAMLQRQQAKAIVAAREKIVEGAVGMVQMALDKLEQEGIIALDEEKKATMVNNLMVAIVAERPAQPVIHTGTIY